MFSQTHSKEIERLIFNYQFDQAFSYIDSNETEIRPPTIALYKSVLHFYHYFSVQPSKRDDIHIKKMVEATTPITDKEDEIIASGHSEDILMLGGCFGFQSMAEYLRKNRFAALSGASKANELLEELYEKDTTAVDALFGIGIYNYALSKPPKVLRFILSVVGYSGDYERGLRYLKRVAKEGIHTNIQSLLFLINHSLYDRTKYAFVYPLLTQFPEEFKTTPMYIYKKLQLEYHLGMYQEVVETFNLLDKSRTPSYVYNRSLLVRSQAYIALNQLEPAFNDLETLSFTKDRFRGGVYYDLRETYADYYMKQNKYKEAHSIYLMIYQNTRVDFREERVEKKLEALEQLTQGELSY